MAATPGRPPAAPSPMGSGRGVPSALYNARAVPLPHPPGCLRAAPVAEPCRAVPGGCCAETGGGWRCSPSAWGWQREGAQGSGGEGRTGGRRRPPPCPKPKPIHRRASVSTKGLAGRAGWLAAGFGLGGWSPGGFSPVVAFPPRLGVSGVEVSAMGDFFLLSSRLPGAVFWGLADGKLLSSLPRDLL